MHEHGAGQTRLVQRRDGFFLEADPLVAFQYRFLLAAVAAGDPPIAFADRRGNVRDLEPAQLARVDRAAELCEGVQEERADEIRLETAGRGFLHLFLDGVQTLGTHRFVGQGVAVEQGLDVLVVECPVDLLVQPGSHFGLIAVADGLQQQILQTGFLEDFAQDVEHAPVQGFALDFDLLQQPVVDVAFAGFLGDQVPQVTNFGLVDAMDAAEPLFQPVGVPGQVVVDHQVGALQVDAFARGVGSHQQAHVGIGPEQRLEPAAFIAVGSPVDAAISCMLGRPAGHPSPMWVKIRTSRKPISALRFAKPQSTHGSSLPTPEPVHNQPGTENR